ncbi:dihydrolipoyl dehydrogenase [Metamycoplasma canadense]|uniref:Dihydrolipoamide dehydrogenase n=1 Tax=Metamycoplasma canadense TaxID=29554 RepID=A0A077LC64_9BACT|nr:dihydrolipoyl dehydrogenase [Metamycoplasma canadense]BAP39694.1 dihydrolipoamide dehydrogenase [Metamycoplasma canadense]
MKEFDVVILGAGPGGYSLANILSSNGKKVALIEKGDLGGTCVNEGCISTKTLIKSVKVLETLKNANEFGVSANDINFDINSIQKRRQINKEFLNNAIKKSLDASGVEIFFGEGKVLNKNTIIVNNKTIKTNKLVIATGASSRNLDVQGYNEAKEQKFAINSKDALYLDKIPESLIIIGTGPIGLEFAYYFSTLGSKVILIDSNKFMSNFDIDLQNNVKQYIEAKGIKIIENAKILKFNDSNLLIDVLGLKTKIEASKVLLAIGRTANIESFTSLNLELNKNNSVKVNKKMETSIKDVYALGDVTGKMMLSTFAYKSGDIIAKEILEKNSNKEIIDTKLIPWSVYLNPEFAGIGYNEQQLQEANIEFNVVKIPTKVLPRVHADNLDKEFGFIKFLISKEDDQILGSFMFVEGAHLIINEVALAMANKISFKDLQNHPFTHPTVAEAIYYAARGYSFKK